MKRRYKNGLIYSIGIILNLIPVILWGNLFNVCCILILLYFWGSSIFSYRKYNFYIHKCYINTAVNINQESTIYRVDCSRMDRVRVHYGMTARNMDLYPETITFLIHANPRKINFCIPQQETRPIKLKNIESKYFFSKILFSDEYEESQILDHLEVSIFDSKLEYHSDSIFYNIKVKRKQKP